MPAPSKEEIAHAISCIKSTRAFGQRKQTYFLFSGETFYKLSYTCVNEEDVFTLVSLREKRVIDDPELLEVEPEDFPFEEYFR